MLPILGEVSPGLRDIPGHNLEQLQVVVQVQGQSHPVGMPVPDLQSVSASPGPSPRRKSQLHIPGVPGKRPRAGLR